MSRPHSDRFEGPEPTCVRIDQGTLPDQLEISEPEGQPATARPSSSGRSNVMLALLMAGTSWAIASCASIWLVPPYLILMAWLLFPSVGRASGTSAETEPGASDSAGPATVGGASDIPDTLRDGPASAGPSEGGSEPGPSSSPLKARRSRGRAKKAKQPAIEPLEATWVQVAPGKFIRVEVSESTTPAGPHGSPGVPVEVAAESPPVPIDRVEPDERSLGEPSEAVESGSSTASHVEETAGPAEDFEQPAAVDGNTPQAEELIEETGQSWLEPETEPLDDQAEAEPVARIVEDEADPSPLSEAFEPLGSPAVPDATPEVQEEVEEEPAETADPTETTVDETDFDDAGPISDDFPQPTLTSSDDTDEPETELLPDVPTGSAFRPWRLARRAVNRVGHPSRQPGRTATSRRPVRALRRSVQQASPRRSNRREPGRPRRITRAFPPRSPPGVGSPERRKSSI